MKVQYLKTILNVVLISIALVSLIKCGQDHTPPLPNLVDFNYDVKPILVQKCYLCHGPDPAARKGGLRLDTFEGATAALKEGGNAIVPGHIHDSKMVGRINHHDPEEIMPPPDSKLKLTEREIAILTKWIKQGATWKPHWAFIPPQTPVLDDIEEGQSEIDFFIEREISKAGLEIAPEGNKNSLIRRVSYILTGLPPTPDALEKYLADNSIESYEKMVDQYLNSPRFGEKWARHWMDVARYAETKGHEFDYVIPGAWRYRDYLINAFNEDVPYNQFVKEQLAGDLLTTVRRDPTTGANESQIGTIFYTMAEGTHSPVDVRKDESDRIDNMIDVTSKAFQGLTVSCARCHDHKFDPIATKDYYALYGIMESTRFSPIPAMRTSNEEKSIEKVNEIKSFLRKLIAEKWIKETVATQHISESKTDNGSGKSSANFNVIGDFRGSDLQGWKSDAVAFGKHTTLGNPKVNERNELIGLEDGKASSRGLGTGIFGALRSPNFIIEKNFIGVRARGKKSSIRIIIDNFQLISYPIFEGMDQKVEKEGWQDFKFDATLWKGHKAYVELLPGTFSNHIYSLSKEAYVEAKYAIAFDGEWVEPPLEHDQSPVQVKKAIENWTEQQASPTEIELLNVLIRRRLITRQFLQANELLSQSSQLISAMADTTYFNGICDGFAINSPVFKRGNHKDLTKKPVPRKFLSAIPIKDSVFTSAGSGRLELAEAILNPQNPLTARVMVNRIWHHLFGRGIVETTDNFGLQGKLPTHPELLDFLAIKFQQDGWSTKKMIKYIVMSETFKRSVQPADPNSKTDTDNFLLAHFPKRRLEAEDIRDALLAVSGRLDTTMYGPPVRVFITDFMQGRGKPKDSGPLDGNGRRSVYQEIRRNFLEPMMVTFDRPLPFTAFGKRNVTNVPAQALVLMNNPFVIQQAELMAKSIVAHAKLGIEERFDLIYRRAFSRKPTKEEIAQAKIFLLSLAKLHKVNDSDILNELIVWKDYCHSIFNSKEFIFLI